MDLHCLRRVLREETYPVDPRDDDPKNNPYPGPEIDYERLSKLPRLPYPDFVGHQIFGPDIKGPQVVDLLEVYNAPYIRYDNTGSPDVPTLLIIGELRHSISNRMRICLQTTYQFVQKLRFTPNFTTIFAALKVVQALENCEEVTFYLTDASAKCTTIDDELYRFGNRDLRELTHGGVRSLAILKSYGSQLNGQMRWYGPRSNVNFILRMAVILYRNLEDVNIDVYGNECNYIGVKKSIGDLMAREPSPSSPRFPPHRVFFQNNVIFVGREPEPEQPKVGPAA